MNYTSKIKSLATLNQNGVTLAGLKENEQIWCFGSRIVKTIPHDDCFKHSQGLLIKPARQIAKAALKLIFAVGRLLTLQTTSKNLSAVEAYNNRLIQELEKPLPEGAGSDSYRLIDQLQNIRLNLRKASASGLPGYKKTCLTGSPHLLTPSERTRKKQAEKAGRIIENLDHKTIPLLNNRIDELKQRLLKEDRAKVEEIFDRIQNKREMDGVNLSGIDVTTQAFKEAAYAQFSKEQVKRVLSYYGLSERKTLKGTDVAALLTGIAANMTLKDLESRYNKVKGSHQPDFSALGEDEVITFLAKTRDIHYRAVSPDPKMNYHLQLAHDRNILFVMSDQEEFNPNHEPDKIKTQPLRKHAHAEFLSHHMAYSLFDSSQTQFTDGILFSMHDSNNAFCLKEAKKVVSGNGLHAALVQPALIRQDQTKATAQLIFRGTYCLDSFLRDISPLERTVTYLFDGPGRVSFEKKRDEITGKIFSEAEKLAGRGNGMNISMEVMGHSLGGSDAQRALEYMAYQLRHKGSHPFSGFHLYGFNSPNVESDIARRFIQSAHHLNIPFKLRYFDIHHDKVQEFGTKRLGYCGRAVPNPEKLSLSIYKFNNHYAETLAALADSPIARNRFKLAIGYDVHSAYLLKLHTFNKAIYNTVFIQNIYTNDRKDAGIQYGKNLERISQEASKQETDDHLVTNSARIGRKIQRFARRLGNTVFPGRHWNDYDAEELPLKDDAIISP